LTLKNRSILALLEEAGIEYKGLFLNADAGFDNKSLKDFLERKEIIANIKANPQNVEQPNVYFDEICTKIGLRLNKQMVALMDIKV